MNEDTTLLHRYAHEGDESAFSELVGRHVNLVWGAAQRITRDHDLARDVAQTVFCDLARKARSLPSATIIPGWLYRSASLAALKILRTNARRSERERLAMIDTPPSDDAETRAANALLPYVDEALATLPEADRDAVLLRYFGGKNYAQIGATAGISDDAAQKRVSRALEKLRAQFLQRGIDVSQGAIAAGLAIASAQAAPVGMATLLSTAAMSSAATATITTILASMKTPLILVSAAVATTAAISIATIQHNQVRALREENAALQQNQASPPMDTTIAPNAVSDDEQLELARLRSEVATLRKTLKSQSADLAALKSPRTAGKPVPDALGGGEANDTHTPQEAASRDIAVNALKLLGLAARIAASDNHDQLPTTFDQLRKSLELTPGGKFSGGVGLDSFEFFPQPRAIMETEPQLILFREKAPRHLVSGLWERCYTLVDGSVQTVTNSTADFSQTEIEQNGTARPLIPAPTAGQ